MGWKPGKYLKKAFKGIKKVVKKIGRGIKKVAKGFMKAVGKLGVVGQLGLMLLMPYAFSALGGWMGSAVSSASSWWTTTASALGQTGVSGAIGSTMNALHTVASGIGQAYGTITEAIGGAVNKFADITGLGKGYDAVGRFFHEKIVNPTKQFFGFEASAYNPMFTGDTSGIARDQDIKGEINYDMSEGPDLLANLHDAAVTGGARVDSTTGEIVTKDGVPKVVAGGKGTDADVTKLATQNSLLADTVEKEIKDSVFEGAKQRVAEETYYALGGEKPKYQQFSSQYNFENLSNAEPSVFDSADLFLQSQGNNWYTTTVSNYTDIKDLLRGMTFDTYGEEMAEFENALGMGNPRRTTRAASGGF